MKGWLTISETAKRLQLEVDTVRKLERDGKLQAARTKGGQRRFREEEVARYQRERQASHRPKSRGRRATAASRPSPRRRPVPPTQRRAAKPPHAGATILDDPTVGWVEPGDEELPDFEDDEPRAPWPRPPRQPPVGYQVPAAALVYPPQPTVPFSQPPSPGSRPSEPAESDPPQARQRQDQEEQARRLQSIKNHGLAAIPQGVPALWRGKVVKDLEQFVTPSQFPPHLGRQDALNIVSARVERVLKGYRQEVARDEEAKKAKVEAERRVAQLVQRGQDYAVNETQDWDYDDMSDARREVEEALRAEVEAGWAERDVTNLVDGILDQWVEDDEDDAEVEDNDDSDDPDAEEW